MEYPDYIITVYCDEHLGVKMMCGKSWKSFANDGYSLDVHPTILWNCPKPGCDRYYEPTFGYHSDGPGLQLQTDDKEQPRCNHPWRTFMYIGNSGADRRYRCPIKGCDVQGSVVAESVIDEEVQLPPNPFEHLRRKETKAAKEMMIFQSFTSAAELPIDKGSAENRDPYFPDILCTISGEKYWFELAQIIHEAVAEKVNPRRRKPDGRFSYDQEQPFVGLVSHKASKSYLTEGAPVDLILHFDHLFGSAAAVRRLCEKHPSLLAALTSVGPFKRVWVFDDFNKVVIWRQ